MSTHPLSFAASLAVAVVGFGLFFYETRELIGSLFAAILGGGLTWGALLVISLMAQAWKK